MWRDRGRHNEAKGKSLIVLFNNRVFWQKTDAKAKGHQFGDRLQEGLVLDELHELAGVSLATLRRSLPRWLAWGLVTRFPVVVAGRGASSGRQYRANTGEQLAWAYQISEKGVSWLRNYAEESLNIARFTREMAVWQEERKNWHEERETELLKGWAGDPGER